MLGRRSGQARSRKGTGGEIVSRGTRGGAKRLSLLEPVMV